MGAIAGFFQVKINGTLKIFKGEITSGYGQPKRSPVFDSSGRLAGYKEEPQVAFLEGKLIDTKDEDLVALMNLKDATVIHHKANGKVEVLSEAYYAADGNVTSGEAEVDFRMEGVRLEEVK